MNSILHNILVQKSIYEKRYKDTKLEMEKAKENGDEKMYYIRFGQLIEIEHGLSQFFEVYEHDPWLQKGRD